MLCLLQDAEAVFQNNEEVRVVPIYRDPVHDFGFFQFNPAVSAGAFMVSCA
jgi:hypothetical protein